MDTAFHDLAALDSAGRNVAFDGFRGKVVLVVNTASKCGLTPQFEGLEALYKKYKDKGLVIVGFPCDQFANQEPGGNEEIQQFCQRNYGVSFPVLGKIEVNGPGAHPVFAWLRAKAPGLLGDKIKWNFTKFLVDKEGRKVRRFSPTTVPAKLEKYLEKALAS